MILFSNSASFTLSLFTMFDADCDSERLCLFTWVRFRDENVGLDSSLFLRLSSLRLWKCVRALTSACSAVFCPGFFARLISLISFWKVLSGAIFALAEYCNDFGHVRLFKCLSSLRIESSVLAIFASIDWWSTYFRLIPLFSGCLWSGGLFSLVLRAGGLGCDQWRWIFVSIILFFGVRWRTARRCSWGCVIDIPITRCIWPEI